GDQKIVAAGSMNPNNDFSDRRIAIARYSSVGNPDATFGSGGPSIAPLSGVSAPALGLTSNEAGFSLVLQADGKAVVAGDTNNRVSDANNDNGSAFAVARFKTNGTLDSGFGNGGWNSVDVTRD